MMLTWRTVAAGAAAAALLASGISAQEITTLTIQEQVGAARTNEPIRMGVPLAKGLVKDVAELGLTTAAGQPVPCQVVEVMRWDDNSLRWVHLIFQASVAAKGRSEVKLVKGPGAKSAGRLQVTEADGAVTVTNGVLKLVVKGANFNLIDAAWYDPAGLFGPETQVVKPHTEGVVALLDGKVHKPGADSKVEIEEQGTEGAVIKVSGKLAAGDSAPFEFVCRLHVFQGSPAVKVDFSYTNVQGKRPADKVMLEDLSLVLPTTALGRAAVGGEGKVFSGRSAAIFAKTSDLSEITVDGQAASTAKGKSTKPLTLGWADVSAGTRGVAVGVRWFWQMFPKAMEAKADGTLRAGLYAKESGAPFEVYMGQARTHYLTLFFHGAMADEALQTFYAGTQMPLRAVATPKYYCRDAMGFGFAADSDPSIYPADVAQAMKAWDESVMKSALYIEKKIDNATYNGVTLDSYGYYAWGDVFHYANTAGVTDKWNILWESNYYDYPWACALQFARTGEMVYLDILDRHGLNLADVFMCHYHPQEELRGACRYSPPANFVGMDTDYQKPQPYVSVEFNHHKAQSILARYYLLGDLRAKDDFLLALNNAMLNPEGNWGQCRGPGAKLATLYSGYILTRDPECLQRMKNTMAGAIRLKTSNNPKGFSRQGPSGYFMMGVATEGMLYYWWLTGDKDTFETIKMVTDFQLSEEGIKGSTANTSAAAAFCYRQTGDERYKKGALRLLKAYQENRPKGFGQSWRNAAYAWYYLSNVGKTN